MTQYNARKEALAKFIQDGHMYLINDVLGRPASQAEYSSWLGISPNTLTRLINGLSLPSLENLIPIADKLGPEAYDICGIPRLAYTDEEFSAVMSYWHALSDAKKRKVVEYIKALQRNYDPTLEIATEAKLLEACKAANNFILENANLLSATFDQYAKAAEINKILTVAIIDAEGEAE